MRSLEINRKDIVTGKIYDRNNLIRICIDKSGTTSIDRNLNIKGRGIYIHPNSILVGMKKRILEKKIKKFGGSFEQIKDNLMEVINGE